jgi:hypothetical protein
MKRFEQTLDFAMGHFAPRARLDPRDRQRPDSNAAEPSDWYTDGVHHSPHEMVHAFVHDNFENEPLGRFTDNANLFRNDPLALDHDSVANALQCRLRRTAQRENVILLVQSVSGVHHAIRDIAVIGQQQQPLGIAIEPANRVDAFRNLDQIHDGAAISFIFDGSDVAAGFVQQDVARALRFQNLAVDSNDRANWIGFRSQFGDHLAIDIDPTGTNQFLGVAP